MRTGAIASLLFGLLLVGCSQPTEDVPASVKNEKPIAGSDRQLAESAAAGRAYGEEMQRQQALHKGG